MVLGDTEHHLWQLVRQCELGGQASCGVASQCGAETPPKYVYTILRDAQPIGTTCLDDDQAADLGVLTPGRIIKEFKAIDWPAPDLTIQPPGGQTLVNLDTIFYTTLTSPHSRTLTLLGSQVTIQATPISYDWHFGDGTTTTTSDPGRPYPNQTITHPYTHTATVTPSVEVTYQGRFRVDAGAWQPIPDTLTITGPTTTLQIRQALPKLTNTN